MCGPLARKPVLEGVEVMQGGATAAAWTSGGCVGHGRRPFLDGWNRLRVEAEIE